MADAEDPAPIVAMPNSGISGKAIAIVAFIAALLLFLLLDGRRAPGTAQDGIAEQVSPGAFAPPPPLAIPAPILASPLIPSAYRLSNIPIRLRAVPAVRQQPTIPATAPPSAPYYPSAYVAEPTMQATDGVPAARGLTEPALLFDSGAIAGGPANPSSAAEPKNGASEGAATSAPRSQPAARPGRIENPSHVVPVGTLIRAVLETPIDTSRPGFARAIVSKGARGFDGSRILIPRGSRLIGEYGAEVVTGQSKVLVNWTQLILPDGSMIKLDSPAADAMGAAGIRGRVNGFFFQRFFNAVLQTALTAGAGLAAGSVDAPVIIGLPGSAVASAAGQGGGLLGQAPRPRIKVRQGAAFNIFVARNLDFSENPSW
ncbi:MAG: TrbI/VirB10 family protein [Sphingosinicella sp.]|nr:TrbI/VirB10 family protein [Sphingosinicella sp.]